jgi:hypothetical protein
MTRPDAVPGVPEPTTPLAVIGPTHPWPLWKPGGCCPSPPLL